VTTAADGAFRLDRLPAEQVELTIDLNEYSDNKEHRTVTAGAPVAIEVDIGAELVVRVENWRPGVAEDRARLTVGGGETRRRVSADGVARFRGLRANASATLWIPALPGGSCVYRTDVRPDGAELRVRLEPSKTVGGRFRLPSGAEPAVVYLQGRGLFVSTHTDASGVFTVEGVPDGEWEISAVAYDASKHQFRAEGRVRAGETVDLTLK
jgi:hypothetical protein